MFSEIAQEESHMTKQFFSEFAPQEKTLHKTVSLTESEWRLVEAYRLYGASEAGHEIPIQKLLKKILLKHVQSDRAFVHAQEEWLTKLSDLEKSAEGAAH